MLRSLKAFVHKFPVLANMWRKMSVRLPPTFRRSVGVYPLVICRGVWSAKVGKSRPHSPTRTQLGAARRELSPSNIRFYSRMFRVIRRDRTAIIDVGANLGYTTLVFQKSSEEIPGYAHTHYYLVEPNPSNQYFLTKNLRNVPNVHILPVGIGTGWEWAKFGVPAHYKSRGRDGSANTGLLTMHHSDFLPDSTLTLPVLPLGSLLPLFGNLSNVFFVKCDIEGEELKFLEQAGPLLMEEAVIEFEFNPRYVRHRELRNLTSRLRDSNYRTLSRAKIESPSQMGLTNLFLVPAALVEPLIDNGLLHPVSEETLLSSLPVNADDI